MMWWSGHWGWGAWLGMSLGMLAFWALVAWVIFMVVRTGGWGRWDAGTRGASDILDERFARGEINEVEYRHRREVLSGR